ncbi:hypothetical protein [Escherichia albertii]|uniref:hypothetical protein n=1 Tax=Escherichia albertii TaxID=208962 RepID=UPI00131521BF|nr:hypothetical protein [Escherichia albertii]WKU82645.1 hypothetical protein MJ90_10480 [Escherichia albertii]
MRRKRLIRPTGSLLLASLTGREQRRIRLIANVGCGASALSDLQVRYFWQA